MDLDLLKEKDKLSENTKTSFYITYVLLLTTGTITLIEALRTEIPAVRHIFNLETCVSIVAGYFYSTFIGIVTDKESKRIDWSEVTKLRYIDWSITTPMMLIVLCTFLSLNTGIKLHYYDLFVIITLNFLMLYSGYKGVKKEWSNKSGLLIGFLFYFLMMLFIFYKYVKPKYVLSNYILFFIYFILWSLYGVVYNLDEENKNKFYNYLDLTAKCFVGLGLWLFFNKLIV
jgi:bacteriorhodopsin